MKKILSLFFCLWVVSGAMYSQTSENGEFVILDSHIEVKSMSVNGKYIVGFNSFSTMPWIWSEEKGLNEFGDVQATPSHVSNDGSVVVGSAPDWDHTYIYGDEERATVTASYFKDGKWHSFGWNTNVPIEPYGNPVHRVSADGTLTVGGWSQSIGSYLPVQWNIVTGERKEQPCLNASGTVFAMSADGSVMGGRIQGNPGYPALWIDGKLRNILLNGGRRQGLLTAISANGKYAGLTIHGLLAIYNIETQKLTTIEMPYRQFQAYDISDDGRIMIGYMGDLPAGIQLPFIYTDKTGLMELEEYIKQLGVEVEGVDQFLTATGMSSDGKFICGNGRLLEEDESGNVMAVKKGWLLKITNHLNEFGRPKEVLLTEKGLGMINISWIAPDSEEGFSVEGYNIYRDGEKVNESVVTGLTYDDINLPNGTYSYTVTAVWSEGNESKPTQTVTMSTATLSLPFYDGFDSLSWDSNFWNPQYPGGNGWKIVPAGIVVPALAYIPPASEYSEYMLSPFINATEATELFLRYNFGTSNDGTDINENKFKIEGFDGEQWHLIIEYNGRNMPNGLKPEIIPISNWAAGKNIRIRFTAYGDNSAKNGLAWTIDDIYIYESKDEIKLEKAIDVKATRIGNNKVSIQWAAPNQTAQLSYLAGETYQSGIGNEGTKFIAANMFDEEQLEKFDGYKMTSIQAYFTTRFVEDPGSHPVYKLVAFQDGKQILDQDVKNPEFYKYNIIELEKPLVINSSKPLYYGIEVVEHMPETSELVLGMDAVPEVEDGRVDGRSNLISFNNGETWTTLTEFKNKYSWMIKANIEKETKLGDILGQMAFGIYRGDDLLLDGYLLNNVFIDENAPDEECCYKITAYNYILQDESEAVESCVGGNRIEGNHSEEDSIIIYPNPVTDNIIISGEFVKAYLYDINGKLILTSVSTNIDVKALVKGIYLLKIETPIGIVNKKIVKQ